MRAYTRYLLVLTLSVVVFTSCRKSASKQAKYIPKTANVIAAVNAKAIAKKLYEGSFTLDSFAAAMHDTADQRHWKENMQKVDELKDAGIDWNSDVLVFMAQKGGMMQGMQTSGGAVALLDDASKLEAYIKKQHKDVKIEKGTDYTFAKVDDGAVVGWNKEVAIFVGGSAQQRMFMDTTPSAQPPSFDAAGELALLMKLNKSESIASVEAFDDLLKEKADMKMFSNPGSSMETVPMLGMTKITDLFKDAYTTATLNFEDGKIVGAFTSYNNKDMASIIEKNAKGDADLNMVDVAPTKPNAFMAMSFNPQMIVDVLKFIGLEKTADDFLASSMKMSSSDILKAFNGDMALVMSDFHATDTGSHKPDMNFVFNAKVGDKATYEKLLSKLEEQKILVRTQNGFAFASAGKPAEMTTEFNSNNILVASDSNYLQQYKAGTKKNNITDEIRDKVKGKPFSMYVDLAGILNGFSNDTSASVRTARTTFKDVVVTSDHIKDRQMKGKFEMRFLNEKENSLTSLMRWMSKVAAAPKKIRFHEGDAIDSTAVAVPIPTNSL